jgi:hypothetical protein
VPLSSNHEVDTERGKGEDHKLQVDFGVIGSGLRLELLYCSVTKRTRYFG